ncbi:MAG: TonB-dependent receptor [Rubrivivax sp.]|nr:TonB-dependent receptor [Rubrivivax sp.]
MTRTAPLIASRPGRPSTLASAIGAALATLAAPALLHAQTAPAADADAQVITVTAQRRAQELQKVPLPVTSLRVEDLEARAITDTLKVASFVPNMFASNNTGLGTANVYYIRGLGNTESIATFDPPVGTYVDDIYISRQNANNFGFFDVERIEVLRGPQGTLFGRNTTGGAMRVILKRPSFTPGGYFGVGLGDFNEVSMRGSFDLPLSTSLATKLSFFSRTDSGYVRNTTTGEKLNAMGSQGIRAAARLQISADLGWDVALEAMEDQGTNVLNQLVNGERVAASGLRRSNSFRSATGAPLLSGAKNEFGQVNDVSSTAITSNLRWAPSDKLSLEFITGVRDMSQKFALDFLNNPVATGGFTIANDGRHQQFSQELKLVGDHGALSWVGGVFFMKEDNRTDLGDLFYLAGPRITAVLADRVLDNDVSTSAIYAQGDYKLGSLTATVGLRYTSEKKTVDFRDNRSTVAAAARLDSVNIAAAGVPLSQSANVTTPRVALSWQIDPGFMVFGSATRGFKSGGWNARGTSAATLQPFAPEFIWSYEAGWRKAFMGNRIRFNGTFFKSDVSQLQTPSAFVGPTGAVTFITRNFADLDNQGLEMDLTADLSRNLSIYLGVGLQDAQYVNIAQSIRDQAAACKASIAANAASRPSCLQGIVDANGDIAKPVRTPRQTINLGGSYSTPVAGQLRLGGSLHASYASRTPVGTANNSFADAHTVLNGSISLSGPKDVWRVTLDCSNCTNEVWNASFLAGFNYLPDPRRVTLKFNYRM